MVPTKIIPSAPLYSWLYYQYLLVESEVLLFIPILLLHITETYWNHAVSKMMIFPIWWLLNSRSLICRKNDFLWVRSPVLAISWFVLVKFKILIRTISRFKSNPDVGRFSSEWSEWCFLEIARSLLWFIGDASFSLQKSSRGDAADLWCPTLPPCEDWSCEGDHFFVGFVGVAWCPGVN